MRPLTLAFGSFSGGARTASIRAQFVKLFVGAFVAAALVFAGGAVWNMSAHRAEEEAAMARTVRSFTVALDERLLRSISALESLAAAFVLDGDRHRLQALAAAVQGRHPDWTYVVLRDAEGVALLRTGSPVGAAIPGSESTSQQVARVLKSGQPQVSDLIHGVISGTPIAMISVPVHAADGTEYVLSAGVSAAKWTELLLRQQIPTGWIAGVIDRTGTVVARSRGADQFVGKPAPRWVVDAIRAKPEGDADGQALDGGTITIEYARSPLSGWTVVFAAPKSDLEGPWGWPVAVLMAGVAATFLAGFFVVRSFSRRVSGSVSALVRSVESINSAGALAAGLPPELHEFDALHQALKQAGSQLRQSEEQRFGLMRELQHRVKNDLQAILSLMTMEAAQARCDDTKRALNELKGKIETLRLIHARLYEASRVGTVELGGYLKELCGNAVALHGARAGGPIIFRAGSEELYAGHDMAVSLGLIANEFVTNSAKHAFPEAPGTIRLDLAVIGPGQARLRLSDDGIGLPQVRPRSSGLQLIAMLARQVGAVAEWRNDGGTCLTLTFPIGAQA